MHRSSFAPELSATLSRVSCWITWLPGLLHDVQYAPAFLAGHRAGLGEADEAGHAALVLLVMHLEAGALLDRLAVQAVRLGRADLHDDRFVHLVRDHVAQPDLALAAGLGRGLGCGIAHSESSFLARRPRLGFGASSSAACSTGGSSTATADATGAASSTDAWMPKSRSRSTVMIRAMSCRTLEIWLEFSSWPTACLKRSS